jgi:hypothetical protein
MRRNALVGVWVALCGAMGTAGLAAAALEAPIESPLVRLHAELKFQEVKTALSSEDLFITRPGTMTGDAVKLPDLTTFWTSSANLGHLDSTQRNTLTAALGNAAVGTQGDCEITHVINNIEGYTGTYTITWWGQGNRANSFTVTLVPEAGALPECRAEVDNLIGLLEKLSQEVLGITPASPFTS